MQRQYWHSQRRSGPAFSHSETIGIVTRETEYETRATAHRPCYFIHLIVLSYFDWSKGGAALLLNQIQQPLLIIFYAEWNLGAKEKIGEKIDIMGSKVMNKPNQAFFSIFFSAFQTIV